MSGIFVTVEQLISTAPFWWVLLLLTVVALAYANVSRWIWLATLAVLLVAFAWYGHAAPVWSRVLAWPVFLAPWVALALPAVRRPLISHRVLEQLRARVPNLTRAELTTLRAGNVWWEGAFFGGLPPWRQLMAEDSVSISDSERRFLTQNVAALCDACPDDLSSSPDQGLPPDVLERMRREKFFGLNIQPRYGGLGYSHAGISAVLTGMATRQPALALTVAAALGPAELLRRHGADAQRDKLLPRLADGRDLAAVAVSGPQAGSDLAALSDEAVVTRDGGDIVLELSFDKRFVTLAAQATCLIVAARIHDPDELLESTVRPGMTLFLVRADAPGVKVGTHHRCVDRRLSQGPASGEGVALAVDDIVGGRDGIGQGWRMLRELQATMRALGVPATASGAARRVSRLAGAYTSIRYQLREPAGLLPGVQESLSRIGAQTYCIEALRHVTLAAYAAGKQPAVIASVARYQCATRLRAIIDDAVEILGAKGVCLGPNNLLEPYLSLAPLVLSADGGDLVSRSLTIYGQGLMRSHPFVARELEAVRDSDRLRGEQRFDELFGQHIAFAASNAVKALLLATGGGRLARVPRRAGWTGPWFRKLSRMSAAFALTNDAMLALFGGDLKGRQRESARMADILGLLYTAATVLKLYRDQGSEPDQRAVVEYLLHDCLWQIQRRFDALFSNLPRLTGWLLRRLVFPAGRRFRRQPDATEAAVAGLLLVPSGARNRLTSGICMPTDTDAPLNLLELAHARVVEDKPLYRKLNEAHAVRLISGNNMAQWLESARESNVLDEDESARLRETEDLRQRVLAVDDYDPGT